jgi:hypothetical protein
MILYCGDESLQVVFARKISLNGERLCAHVFYLLYGLVKRTGELLGGTDRTRSERYVRASAREVECRLFANAPAGTGDDDYFACETAFSLSFHEVPIEVAGRFATIMPKCEGAGNECPRPSTGRPHLRPKAARFGVQSREPNAIVLAMNRRAFIRAAGAAGLSLTSPFGLGATDSPAVLLLLEDTPRERIPRELVRLIRAGLRYEDLLSALALAAVRNVQPYPDVGYKYHSVMMLRSMHLTTEHLSSSEKWLPVAWATDYFKETQAQERNTDGWRMPTRVATPVGSAQAARQALIVALDNWDRDAADAAILNYTQLGRPEEIFSLLFRYGARDLRAIGHKAIAVSNAHFLTEHLGFAHAAPMLRSTVAALQNSDRDPNPASHDLPPDQPWRQNLQRLREIPRNWKHGRDDSGARAELHAALYRVSEDESGTMVIALLRRGVTPEAIWQVLFDTAAELLMYQPSILALHAQTTANALHYAYRVCAEEEIQQLGLLQCAAFIAMFRKLMNATQPSISLEALQTLPLDGTADAIDEIFAEVSAGRRSRAARKALGYLKSGGDAEALIAKARHHLVYNADEPHDYKFAEAVFDNYAQLPDSDWRYRYLCAGMTYFKAPAKRPGPLVEQMLERLKT